MLQCPRKLVRTAFYSAALMLTVVAPALALDPTGDWRVAEGVANIRVAECNGSMWGAVSWEQTPGGRDTQNPDVSKQNRPTLGMPILIDLKRRPGADQWEGQVYNAKDGQHYGVTIKPKFRAVCWAFSAAAKPGPVSQVRFRLVRPIAWPKARPRARARHRRAPTPPAHRRPPGQSTRPPKGKNRRQQRPQPIRSAISVYSPRSRGLPISAG